MNSKVLIFEYSKLSSMSVSKGRQGVLWAVCCIQVHPVKIIIVDEKIMIFVIKISAKITVVVME